MSILKRALKNQTIGVTLLDNATKNAEPEEAVDPLEGVVVAAAYVELAKDLITHAAFTIGGVYAACKIVERICK